MVAVICDVGWLNSCPALGAVILEEADVLDARVALEIQNALGRQAQKLPNLVVAGIPQLPVVPGILDQHFVSAHGTHAVVNAVAAPARLAFNVIERRGMHHRSRRPPDRARHGRDDLRGLGRIRAKTAGRFRTRRALRRVVSRHDPGASDGIFAEFHVLGKHCGRSRVNCHFR